MAESIGMMRSQPDSNRQAGYTYLEGQHTATVQLDALDTRLNARIDALGARLDTRIDPLDARLPEVAKKSRKGSLGSKVSSLSPAIP